MSLILTEVAVIYVTVCIEPLALAMHLAVLKLSLVAAEVRPLHDARPL